MSKLLDRTAALQPTDQSDRTARPERPRSAPGRMFEFAQKINEAEDRATAATAEAEAVKKLLENAYLQIEALQKNAVGIEIDISTLVEVPGRRRVLSPIEYAELRTNLGRNPLIHPIVYRPLGDGKNEIVAGNNRVAIYRDDLGRTKILGIPFTGDAKSAELGAAFSNLLSAALPDYEKYRQFLRLQNESGFTREDILEASGLSTSHVYRILAFDKLPPEAHALIAKRPDRIGGHAAEEFASLAKDGDTQLVVRAIEALINDEAMTQKQALELAKPKPVRTGTSTTETRPLLIGKKKLCDVSIRDGFVGFRFNGKISGASTVEWAEKIENFIRAEIAAKAED